jgi:folate-binding protein YgfZ
VIDRSDRGKLAVHGEDAAAFLDSLVSNDVSELVAGSGTEATLLTHKGRLLAVLRILCTERELLLDCERSALQACFDVLRHARIGHRAQLERRTLECGLLSLIGPSSDSLLPAVLGGREHEHTELTIGDLPARAVRTDLGVDLLCASAVSAPLLIALATAGAVPIDEATAECVRIEHGRPRFGVEIDESTMPQEAGLHERAVSYTKGCYVGQETVARLYWKGRPNRVLQALTLSEPLPAGTPLLLEGHAVGTLGSAADSPRFGPVGLALIRREAQPGAELEAGQSGARARIVELPFSPR